MRKPILIVCILLLAVLAACSGKNDSETSQKDHNPKTGDSWEQTASKDDLPDFLSKSEKNMQTLYLAVASHRELLEQIPCYCGCGESADHTSNYDCFIHDNGKESVTWDDHATRCQACLDIAAESISQSMDGTPLKDIRRAIDEAYKEGYAEPTPTPAI
ncbi:PCYCGC motif-containing (lipo)protein [Virgibacillus halophilus]|uniref:PCYCGC motif-containing (lipo)protein n=1 Tax=Tigheibacillus halophilus TaxID=361280 RepID=UPI003633CC46